MKLNNEAKVGLMITFSLTVFIVLVALLSKFSISQKGYNLRLYFGFLNGLKVGAPVKIAGGIKIGFVETISQSDEKTEVKVWVDKKFTLIKTTKFAIFTTGLIGEKYINVFVPPTINVEEFLNDGDRVFAVDPASFDQMMLIFQGFMQDQSGGEMLAAIFQNSKNFVENLNRLTAENRGDVRQSVLHAKSVFSNLAVESKTLLEQLNKFTGNLATMSEKNKEEFSIAMRNLSEITDKLNKIVFRLEQGRGTLGKLMTEEEIYNNLKDASVSARDLFKSLQRDPSKLFYRQQRQD